MKIQNSIVTINKSNLHSNVSHEMSTLFIVAVVRKDCSSESARNF